MKTAHFGLYIKSTLNLIIMKIISCICLLAICSVIRIQAQGHDHRGEARERIEAQRVAFITQKLRLTPDESAAFWPVYNEYRDGLKDLRDDIERPDLLTMSDQEASALIDKHLLQEQKRIDLKRTLVTRLKSILAPRKILMLHVAENQFNRELLQKAQEFRRQ